MVDPVEQLRSGPVVVVGMAPIWGMPSPSPFCSKLETWLRMAEIPYTAKVMQGPSRAATGKIPYLELPDGGALPDSGRIIEVLTEARGVQLDAHLSAADQALAHLLRRTMEEHLYFTLAWSRWVPEPNYALVQANYFRALPGLLRPLIGRWIRGKVRANLEGQGVGRLPPEQIAARAAADLAAISAVLGEREWFFGRPSTTDAIAYGFIGGLLGFPAVSPIQQAALRHPNLVAHTDRVRLQWWGS